MRDPKMCTPTAIPGNPEMWNRSESYPEKVVRRLCPNAGLQIEINLRVRGFNAAVFSHLAHFGEHTSGSLREQIAEIAPYANDHDTEDRIDE